MAIDPPEPCPERERLATIIAHCRKRVERSAEKEITAMREKRDAIAALDDARRTSGLVRRSPRTARSTHLKGRSCLKGILQPINSAFSSSA